MKKASYPESEAIHREGVEVREQDAWLRTPGYVSIATSNLATLLRAEGKNAESEKLNRDTLPVWRRVFGIG